MKEVKSARLNGTNQYSIGFIVAALSFIVRFGAAANEMNIEKKNENNEKKNENKGRVFLFFALNWVKRTVTREMTPVDRN